jgi:hypothetical protein
MNLEVVEEKQGQIVKRAKCSTVKFDVPFCCDSRKSALEEMKSDGIIV